MNDTREGPGHQISKLDRKKCRKRIVEYGTFYPKVSQGSLICTEIRVKRLYGAGYEFYKPTILLNFSDKSKRMVDYPITKIVLFYGKI